MRMGASLRASLQGCSPGPGRSAARGPPAPWRPPPPPAAPAARSPRPPGLEPGTPRPASPWSPLAAAPADGGEVAVRGGRRPGRRRVAGAVGTGSPGRREAGPPCCSTPCSAGWLWTRPHSGPQTRSPVQPAGEGHLPVAASTRPLLPLRPLAPWAGGGGQGGSCCGKRPGDGALSGSVG